LTFAKTTKDAEVSDLVNQLETVTAEVCHTREQKINLASECKEVAHKHE